MALSYILMNKPNLDQWLSDNDQPSFEETVIIEDAPIDVTGQTAVTKEVPLYDENGIPTGETVTVFDYWDYFPTTAPERWGGINVVPLNDAALAVVPPNWGGWIFTSRKNKLEGINNQLIALIDAGTIPGDPWIMLSLYYKEAANDDKYNLEAVYDEDDRIRINNKMNQLFPGEWTDITPVESQESAVKRIFRQVTHPDFGLNWFRQNDPEIV